MVYTNLTKICESMIERNRMFWRVFQKDEKNMIAECINYEGLTPKISADFLKREIEGLEGTGYVVVRVFSEPPKQGGNNHGRLDYYVKIGDEVSPVAGGYQGNNFGMPNFQMIQGFNETITGIKMDLLKEQHKSEMKALEEKYKDKNQEIDPYLKEIVGIAKMAFIKPPVNAGSQSGAPRSHQEPINGINDKKEFSRAIQQWMKADPDYLEAIKAIAHFAEHHPEDYKSQISLLISHFKNQ